MAKFLTTMGINKLLSASPLDPIEIKSLVVGTGTGTPTQDITALFNEVYRSNASDPIKNGAKLGFATVIPLDAGSWSLTEWGWIDSAGDLIAYGQFDNPIYKEAGSMTLEPTLYIELSNSTDSQMFITDVLNFPHNELTGRSESDAHPISSITGLSKAIGLKSNKITASKVLTVDDYGAFDVDASSGNIVITMPDVSLVASNNYVFTRTDNTTNTVFFQPFGINKFIAEGVAGANSRLLQYETSWFKKLDANNWVGGRSVQEQLTSISGKPWLVSKGVGVSRFLMENNVVNALNSTDTLNPLSAAQGKVLNDQAFGVGQTWQDMTSLRVPGVTYTNTTGKPIFIAFTKKDGGGSGTSIATIFKVGLVNAINVYDLGQYGHYFSTVVPQGATYILEASTDALVYWAELR